MWKLFFDPDPVKQPMAVHFFKKMNKTNRQVFYLIVINTVTQNPFQKDLSVILDKKIILRNTCNINFPGLKKK